MTISLKPPSLFPPLVPGPELSADAPLPLSPIVFGAATFSPSYNNDGTYLKSSVPYETVVTAFRQGVNAIDTSPYYTSSESVLGGILGDEAFRAEFPRSSYFLITKCGRYGPLIRNFDYSPQRILKSIEESCHHLKTSYLDVVYLHDVEFVADIVGPSCQAGYPATALESDRLANFGLAKEDAGRIHGPGDEQILDGLRTLFKLKDQGTVNRVGISGFPLPTLLRVARLAVSHVRPLDIVQSYSHHTLHNDTLPLYVPHLIDAGVRQVVNASPLSMGLLRTEPAPPWHPAPKALVQAIRTVPDVTRLSLGFGMTSVAPVDYPPSEWTSTVIGFSNPRECEEAFTVYRRLYLNRPQARSCRSRGQGDDGEQAEGERSVLKAIGQTGFIDWSWASPPESAKE